MNLKAKPLFSLLIIAAFVLSFSFIATSSAAAISKDDKVKYEACLKAIKKANSKKKFKEGSTYDCPNIAGDQIVYSKKKAKQEYKVDTASDSSKPGTTTSGPSTSPSTTVNVTPPVHQTCKNEAFFSFPTWYQYLDCDESGGISQDQSGNLPVLIILAAIDILLVLAGFAAVVYGMYGGFKLIISQGQPDGIAKGRTTILNATVGLVIAILASQIVSFIASKLSS